jgi:phosphonate transport system permease protein
MKNIRVKPINKQSIVMTVTMVTLLLLTIYGFTIFDYGEKSVIEGFKQIGADVYKMFFEPKLKHFTFMEAIKDVGITLGLAVLTTVIGAVIAFFLSLLAANNLSKTWVSSIIKAIVAFIRAVPTVLWVLIFAVAAGLGSVAAVLGMTFHSVGYLIKAFSEAFEEIDKGTIEALKATGANWWQTVFQAVVPSTTSYIISWTFLRFELNFTVAVAMGAAAGAGGIGYQLFMASGYYFNIREVGSITYFILIIAIIMEIIATRMKVKIHVGNY